MEFLVKRLIGQNIAFHAMNFGCERITGNSEETGLAEVSARIRKLLFNSDHCSAFSAAALALCPEMVGSYLRLYLFTLSLREAERPLLVQLGDFYQQCWWNIAGLLIWRMKVEGLQISVKATNAITGENTSPKYGCRETQFSLSILE